MRSLLTAATRWGIAPETAVLPESAQLVLHQLETRLSSAPDENAATAMSTDSLSAAASALISPTGQVGLTATLAGTELPALTPAPNSTQDWLSVVVAVRPALARLEAHQLTAEHPFATWVNRGDDVWPSSRSLPRSRRRPCPRPET